MKRLETIVADAKRWIKMTAQSERKRLAEFFRTEYWRLQRFGRCRVDEIPAQDAEDIIHDVALHLFDKTDVAGPVEHLSAYVYRSLIT